jgi:hypothetical protein
MAVASVAEPRADFLVKQGMRLLARTALLILAVLSAAWPGAAAAKGTSKPLELRPHWRLIVKSGLLYATVSNRYVAFLTGFGGGPVTLLDDQTGARAVLSPPSCSTENSNWDTWDQPLFLSDRWLLVSCGQVPPSYRETYDLYNITTRQWSAFPLSARCKGKCQVVGIGAYWVKVLTDEGIVMYGPSDYYLQNITTGQFERDPAHAYDTVFDDLNAPFGSAPLCKPLRYPSVDNGAGHLPPPTWPPGPLRLYGRFAITYQQGFDQSGGAVTQSYDLRRCGLRLDIALFRARNNGFGPPAESPPLGNLHAVIQTVRGATIRGWFFPSLQRFTIQPRLQDDFAAIGLTNRTIYTRTPHNRQLWAATLPSPRHPHR